MDTPGVCDSRGLHKDDENLAKIIDSIVQTIKTTITFSAIVFFINDG